MAGEGGDRRSRELKKKRKTPKGRPARWTAWTSRENVVSREQESRAESRALA